MGLIDSSNCPSFEIECGKKQGTGFLINPTTVLTVRHVVEESFGETPAEITIYEHGKNHSPGHRFKVKKSSETLASLEYAGEGLFPFKHIQLYRCPANKTSKEGELRAYGFLHDTNSNTPYPYPLKHAEETENPSRHEFYNVHFCTSSYISYGGLSGSPIFWENRLYGILGYEKELDFTRVFGLCGEEFFKELGEHACDIPIHDSDWEKILPGRPPVLSPDRHQQLLREALACPTSGPVFISGADGIGKYWLAINFGLSYQGGNVYHIPFAQNFEKTIKYADLPILEDNDRDDFERIINRLKKCESNDVLIITGANLGEGYRACEIDQSPGYKALCSLKMRVLITTRQPVPCEKPIWLEEWSSEDLHRIVATRFFPSEDKQKREQQRRIAERFFEAIDYNPLMAYLVIQNVSNFGILEKITDYLQNPSVPNEDISHWLKDPTKRENPKLAPKPIWDHMFDIFDPTSLSEIEQCVLGLVLFWHSENRYPLEKEIFDNCFHTLESELPKAFCGHQSAFAALLEKGVLAVNAKNEVIIPTISRLNFRKKNIPVDGTKKELFQKVLKKCVEEFRARLAPRIQLAWACADSYDRGYRDFFDKHSCEDGSCALCHFDKWMDDIWDTATKSTEEISDKLGKAYQHLKAVYSDGAGNPLDVFAGKYYSLFAKHKEYPQEMERFLKIQPCGVSEFFHRHNLLSVLYGLHENYSEAKAAAEKAQDEAKYIAAKYPNCYADICAQLGLCWKNLPAEDGSREQANNLREAIIHFTEANSHRSMSERHNLILHADTYKQIADCYFKQAFCDSDQLPRFDEARSNAIAALELDWKGSQTDPETFIKYVEKDCDFLIGVCCAAAVYELQIGNYEGALRYIETAENTVKAKRRELKNANQNVIDTQNDDICDLLIRVKQGMLAAPDFR